MATVKVKFRSSSILTNEGTLFYQVIHRRVVRQISTCYKLYSSEWDCVHSRVILSSENEVRKNYLIKIKRDLSEDIIKWNRIITDLDSLEIAYTTHEVINLFLSVGETKGFCVFVNELIEQMEQLGKVRIAETYKSSLASLMRYYGKNDIPFEKIDEDFIMDYERYLKIQGVCPNTISFYMRNLRAMYNRAVDKGVVPQRYPFKRVYTGIDKTVKRAIPLGIVRKIKNMNLSKYPNLDYARDIFMFSFYTRGMSFVDMAFLKKKDLQNGILSYRRKKTNQQLFIKWEEPMQRIIDKYNTSNTPYLLPIITDMKKSNLKQYRNALHLVNRKLKIIGKRLGLMIPLTTYVSRHGWASIAKSKNISISVISEAMGHDSERTTRIYLTSLDTSVVDKANKLILKSL